MQAPRAVAVAAFAVLCTSGTGARAQPPAIDVHVNAHTTGIQFVPDVAIDANDNFVVVWQTQGQDGDLAGVFGRRFDAAGTPLGPEFQVNAYTTSAQSYPRVAMRPSGEFAVVWQSFGQDGSFGGIFGQLFDASANAVGAEFQVNGASVNAQRSPSVAMDESGRFVVVWQGYTTGGLWDIWARQFDADGNPLAADFVINAYTTGLQTEPSISADGAGNFVIAWASNHSVDSTPVPCGGGGVRSYARRFDAAATPQGPDFAVSSSTTQEQRSPRVSLTDAGHFMVVWEAAACEDRSAKGRVFDASGTPVGPDIVVDAPAPPVDPDNHIVAFDPTVAADEAGEFVVAWHRATYQYFDDDQYGYYFDHIRTRRYAPSGSAIDAGSPASTAWFPDKAFASVAARKPGRFIVAWMGETVGGGLQDIFARAPDVIFSDAFETRDLSSWSAVAIDGGDVSVSPAAAMPAAPERHGLQVVVDDQSSAFVQDDTPAAETRYRARFYFDPNGFDPGESVGKLRQRIFLAFSEAPLKRLVLLMLRRIGGQYAVGAHVREDDESLAKTAFFPITDAPHAIEFDWQRATAPGANDGRFEMWIDGTSVVALTGLDTDERSVDFVRMGAVSVKAGASGTLYFDEFVSRRLAHIGP
jgi:hypothetical protein